MKNLHHIVKLFAVAGFCVLSAPILAKNAEEILKKADDIRNPALSYRLRVKVESPDEEVLEFQVDIKGKDKTLTRTISPARDKGKNMLMLGEDMWAYLPNLKRAVRVSLNQRLTGQAANGDICRQRWSGNYHARVEKEDPKTWVLMLDSKSKNLTYDKIRLYVGKKGYRPIKAEYLTKTGKPLKKARFESYKFLLNKKRPTKTIITSAVKDSDRSVITVLEMEVRDFPDTQFNQNNLR